MQIHCDPEILNNYLSQLNHFQNETRDKFLSLNDRFQSLSQDWNDDRSVAFQEMFEKTKNELLRQLDDIEEQKQFLNTLIVKLESYLGNGSNSLLYSTGNIQNKKLNQKQAINNIDFEKYSWSMIKPKLLATSGIIFLGLGNFYAINSTNSVEEAKEIIENTQDIVESFLPNRRKKDDYKIDKL